MYDRMPYFYFKAGHGSEFVGFLISIVIAFVLGTILTYVDRDNEGRGTLERRKKVSRIVKKHLQ